MFVSAIQLFVFTLEWKQIMFILFLYGVLGIPKEKRKKNEKIYERVRAI